MKVNEFIEGFKANKIMNSKLEPTRVEDYIRTTLEVKEYVPFARKREICARVLNACNTKDLDSGLVKVDSVSRYIVFTITMLIAYTNLEFSSGEDGEYDSIDDYDALCASGLLNPILDVIGAEYIACNDVLNMMMADIVANNNTIENVLGSAAKKLLGSIDTLIDALAEKVEDINFDLNQIDIDKYKGLIDMFSKK